MATFSVELTDRLLNFHPQSMEQLLGASVVLVGDTPQRQRVEVGTPPPMPLATQVPTASSSVAHPVQTKARAVREFTGNKEVGVLVVGDIVVLRISTSVGGKTPIQRVEVTAEKLNRLHAQGLKPAEISTGTSGSRVIILARDEVLIAVDASLAKANATTPANLAALWVNALRHALQQLK